MATKLQQFTFTIACSNFKCRKQHPVTLPASSQKKAISLFKELQERMLCPACELGTKNDANSRLLQASGLKDMYRPIDKKPFAVDTNYDADGTPKKVWRNFESKTERALRECSADNQKFVYESFWFEGTLEAFMSL